MSRRRKSYEQWEHEQRQRDPSWDQGVREAMRTRGPRRKIPLLLDENLELEFVTAVSQVRHFRVTIGRHGASDSELWSEARRAGAVLVTADGDFWNDRRYPLAQGPMVIILSGRSALEKWEAFVFAVNSWGLVEWWRKFHPYRPEVKLKVWKNDMVGKFWDGASVVNL